MRALFKVPVVALILAFLAPNVGVVRVAVHGQSLPRLFEAPSPNAHASKRAVKAHQVRKARLRLELLDTPEFTLNLFDNAERVVRKTKVDRPANDCFVWHGRTDDGGIVSFAVVKGVATGTVFLDGRTFEVTSDGKGDYDIAELNPAAFPTEDAPLDRLDLQADAPGSGTVSAAAASADGTVEIDVMVLWTPAARNAVGGSQSAIESLVLSAVANANLTYTNSQGNARLRLVHSGEVAFTEAGIQTDLSSLTTNGDGTLDSAHSLRQQFGADVVTLLGAGYAGQGYCGIGYLMQSPSTSFAPYAFNVVDQSCAAGNLSYAHEVGHNQGLQHDAGSASSTPSFPYAYGYQDPSGAFRTVMAYGGAPRVPHLSNPSVAYNGLVTGSSNQNNAQALNNTASTVAAFRASSGGSTPTCTYSVSPSSLSFGSSGGVQSVTVSTQAGCSWTASTGAAWLSSGAGGSGSGSVSVTAQANAGSGRNGSVVVAGVSVNVSQAAPAAPTCTYSVSPVSLSFGSSADSKSVSVTTQAGCAWTVTPSASAWVTVAGGGSGSGTASVSVAQNTGSARSASLGVAGASVGVAQAAPKGKGNGKGR